MRERLIWGKISYKLLKNKDIIKTFNNVACFSRLSENCPINEFTHMLMFDLDCEVTKKYTTDYLKYISEMLELEDVEIVDNTIKFKAYNCNYKNMLVGSVLRFLIEPILGNNYITNAEQFKFIENVITSICPYTDKLERFCYFYSKIESDSKYGNGHQGHTWGIKDTKIKSTKDWLNSELRKGNPVNNFFTT